MDRTTSYTQGQDEGTRTVDGLTFAAWMRKVDARVGARFGLSVMDLPDNCWNDLWSDGCSAREAADDFMDEQADEMGMDDC